MKRKYGFIILSLIAVLVLFASCEQNALEPAEPEVDHGDVVDVGMVILEDKVLGSEINRDIKYWEFMATPLFELGDGEYIYGTVSYWRALAELNTGSDGVVKKAANLGRYTSGNWRFELRALNSEKHVIAVGSKVQIVREGLDNTINITVYTDNADGTNGQSIDDNSRKTGWDGHTEESKKETTKRYGQLHVGLVVNKLDSNVYDNMQIITKYQKIDRSANLGSSTDATINWTVRKGAVAPTIDSTGHVVVQGVEGEAYTNWYKTATPNNYNVTGDSAEKVELGKVYYEGVLTNLDAGSYIFTFYIQGKDKSGSWINLGGQAVDVVIIGGEETLVKGTVLANEYVMAGLKITAPGTIYGTINGKNYAIVDGNNSITLTWQQTQDEANRSGEGAVRYYWYVNGQVSLTTSPSFTFQVNNDGSGNPLYGIYRVTCVPTGNLGSTGTSTIDVICNPTVGPNVGEFDWDSVLGS